MCAMSGTLTHQTRSSFASPDFFGRWRSLPLCAVHDVKRREQLVVVASPDRATPSPLGPKFSELLASPYVRNSEPGPRRPRHPNLAAKKGSGSMRALTIDALPTATSLLSSTRWRST
jgi:hypothetical protein